MSRKIVFLDRDGSINIDFGYVYRKQDWQFLPGAVEGLKLLRRAGYALAVVSNQSGVGRGYFTLRELETLDIHMREQLADLGIRLDAVAYCPHAPSEDCVCRKPKTGLYDQVITALGYHIDCRSAWVAGDSESDVQFGRNIGARTARIRPPKEAIGCESIADISGDSLLAIAQQIVRRSGS